jgi:hypothetical protein
LRELNYIVLSSPGKKLLINPKEDSKEDREANRGAIITNLEQILKKIAKQ